MKFEGLYAPVITPHEADGAIDQPAFAAQIDYLIESGIHGIIVGGSTGEYYAQSIEERVDSAQKAKSVIAGRVPLIIGTGAIRQPDSLQVARAARDMQADAILVSTPPYAVPKRFVVARQGRLVRLCSHSIKMINVQ
ncbi:MAG: 4-hydroxy-tetrahydrodipicolinate synthase [Parasphingorhabdus sp.]|jgi:4-hydroxy-tetrahydrodipicolinate synthase